MTDTSDFSALEQQVLDEFARREADALGSSSDGGNEPPPGDTPPSEEIPPAEAPVEPHEAPGTLPDQEAPAPPADDIEGDTEVQPTFDEIEELEIDGTAYSIDTIESALKVKEWADGLDDTAVQTIDAALSGNYVLVPITDLPAIQRFYESQSAAPPQAPPQAGDKGWEDVPLPGFEDEDPRLQQLQQQVSQLTEAQQREQEAQVIQWTRTEIDTGAEEFWSANPDISPEDRARLEDHIIQSNLYAGLAAVHPPRTAIQMALQQAAATDQDLVNRRLQQQVDAQVAAQLDQLHRQAQQTAGSTALSGTSAPVSQQTKPAQTPQDAVAAAIARAMQG